MVLTFKELKSQADFQIDGILALDGLSNNQNFPFLSSKPIITEHNFMWVIENPDPKNFAIFFYFYPIQSCLKDQTEEIFKIHNFEIVQAYIKETQLIVRIGGLFKYFENLRINQWNSFLIKISLDGGSYVSVNGKKEMLIIEKEGFKNFVEEKEFFGKIGIIVVYFFVCRLINR